MRVKVIQDVQTSEVKLVEDWPDEVDPTQHRFLGYTSIVLERRISTGPEGRGVFEQIRDLE